MANSSHLILSLTPVLWDYWGAAASRRVTKVSLKWQDLRGRSITTLTKFYPIFTTYTYPLLTFVTELLYFYNKISMIFSVRTTYLPHLVNVIKVHIFWEGHKILQNLHSRCVLCSNRHILVELLQNFVVFSKYMNFKERPLWYLERGISRFALFTYP